MAQPNIKSPAKTRITAPYASLGVVLLAALVIALLPVIGLVLWIAIQADRRDREQARIELGQLTQVVAAYYGGRIEDSRRVLSSLAYVAEVRDALDGSPGAVAACTGRLAALAGIHTEMIGFGVWDLQGNAVCTNVPLLPGVNVVDRLWFREAVANNAFAVGEFQLSRPTGLPALAFGAPLLDDAGRMRAIVSTGLRLDSLSGSAAALPLPDDTLLTVVDHRGVVLARNRDPEQWIGREIPNSPGRRTMQATDVGVFEGEAFDGVPYTFGFARVLGPGGVPVTLALGRPRAALYGPADQALATLSLGVGAVVLVSLLMFAFIIRLVVLRPVRRLIDATGRLAAGDLDARTGLTHRLGEVGALAFAFDAMARELQATVSSLRRSEALVRESQARLQRALQAVRMVAWEWDPRADQITTTENVEDVYGVPGLAGVDAAFALVHPDDKQRHHELVQRAVRDGSGYRSEFRIVRPNTGEVVWLEERGQATHDADGEMASLVGVVMDVTARKQAELERAWLSDAVANSAESIVVRGLTGPVLYWSPGAERLLGYTADEMIGQSVGAVIPSDREHEQAEITERVARGERISALETVRLRKDGSQVEVAMSLSPVVDGTGQVIAICAIASDISERKRAQAALVHQLSVNRTIMENATLALFMMDEQQRCTYMNAAAERLTGFSLAEVKDRPLHEYVHHTRPDGSPYPLAACPIDRALPEKARTEGEETFVHRDGHFYPVAFTASPILANGRPVGTVIEVRDVTREKRLAQEQRDFFANVSHELRNPLAAVRGFAQLMERRQAYDDRAIRSIVGQTDQLDRLVGDLLEASRLESGALDLRPEPLDLLALAQSCLDESKATSERHVIHLEAPDRPLEGVWDAQRLSQIFRNVLGNAIKYSPDGGNIIVRIEDRGDAAEVSIRDHGLGMDHDVVARLFQRYYRADAIVHSVKGLGLGLFITRELVEAHGGRVWAVSDGPGHGSAFHFTLPYRPPPQGAASPEHQDKVSV